ncbi:MAG UNVERIFIED_CONTAM: translation initiation factor [Planctomycetaceae bacterium]
MVRDLNPDRDDLPGLLTLLKSACGAGGTITEGLLEIQGAQRERVSSELLKLGYKVR